MGISDRSASIIRNVGAALFVVGLALFAWSLGQYDGLPNYLRLATFAPLAFSIPMVTVESYRSRWPSLHPVQKGRAIAWLFIPFIVAAATLIWYVVDPSAKA